MGPAGIEVIALLTDGPTFALLTMAAAAVLGSGAAGVGAWLAVRRRDRDATARLDRIEGRLAAIESTARRLESAPTIPPKTDRRPDPADRTPIGPRHAAPPRHDRPEASAIGPPLIAVPDLSGAGRGAGSQAEAARRATTSADLARRFGRVWELADAGASADRIASTTGQPVGEVELVLNLRRRLLDGGPAPDAEVPG